jgi:hypothetical protein
LCFADADAIKAEQHSKGLSNETNVSATDGSTREMCSMSQPELLKNLGVADNNKCSRLRANDINKLLAKFFHNNALPFNLVESDDLKELIKALCPAYYQQGIPGRFWMETTGVDIVYDEVHEEVEQHLHDCDALMANMDGWENEKKQQLKIVTVTGNNKILFLMIWCHSDIVPTCFPRH